MSFTIELPIDPTNPPDQVELGDFVYSSVMHGMSIYLRMMGDMLNVLGSISIGDEIEDGMLDLDGTDEDE